MVQLTEQDTLNVKLLAEHKGIETETLLSDLLHTAIQQEIDRAALSLAPRLRPAQRAG